MKSGTSLVRLVFATLNQQTPEQLLSAAVVVPLTGVLLLWLVTALAPVLGWLLLAWGLLLLSMSLVKFAQRGRFSR
jgi:hypothetical protein